MDQRRPTWRTLTARLFLTNVWSSCYYVINTGRIIERANSMAACTSSTHSFPTTTGKTATIILFRFFLSPSFSSLLPSNQWDGLTPLSSSSPALRRTAGQPLPPPTAGKHPVATSSPPQQIFFKHMLQLSGNQISQNTALLSSNVMFQLPIKSPVSG